MKRSEVVGALAKIASQGVYKIDPQGARIMNEIFDRAAQLINELEAEEREEADATETE